MSMLYLVRSSVNYMVTSVLYDQFRALNNDFRSAVGCRGEFQGSIREFRRRHQELSQSVQNADQFMMISNVANFCCQILNVILILYCSIFFGDQTVGLDAMGISATMYVYWLASTLFGLTLTACQGAFVNHAVRTSVLSEMCCQSPCSFVQCHHSSHVKFYFFNHYFFTYA